MEFLAHPPAILPMESRFPGEQLAQASGMVVAHSFKGSSLKDGVRLSSGWGGRGGGGKGGRVVDRDQADFPRTLVSVPSTVPGANVSEKSMLNGCMSNQPINQSINVPTQSSYPVFLHSANLRKPHAPEPEFTCTAPRAMPGLLRAPAIAMCQEGWA